MTTMDSAHMPLDLLHCALRWSARVLTLPALFFMIATAIGTGGSGPSPRDWLLLALFPVGMTLGLIIGWRWELVGGTLSVSCLGAFYLLHYVLSHRLPGGPWFLIFTVPGILFLLAGSLPRPGSPGLR
jgi:hypothetical protein